MSDESFGSSWDGDQGDDELEWYHIVDRADEEEDTLKKIAIYRDGLKKFPESFELYCSLGVLYKEMGMIEDAEKCYEKGLALNPGDPVIMRNKALILAYDREQYDEARKVFESVLDSDPPYLPIWHSYAQLLDRQFEG